MTTPAVCELGRIWVALLSVLTSRLTTRPSRIALELMPVERA
jgi:hypothetical protein